MRPCELFRSKRGPAGDCGEEGGYQVASPCHKLVVKTFNLNTSFLTLLCNVHPLSNL